MVNITINEELCKGCELCTRACPKDILELSKTTINTKGYSPAVIIDKEKCIGCAACARICPDVVIHIEKD